LEQSYTVEKESNDYRIGFISKSLKIRDMLVSRESVRFFCNALLKVNGPGDYGACLVDKVELQSYLWRHIPQPSNFKITVTSKHTTLPELDKLYAALFQGGVNKKYYYEYYILPLKVLEHNNVIEMSRSEFVFSRPDLKRFMKGVFGKSGNK